MTPATCETASVAMKFPFRTCRKGDHRIWRTVCGLGLSLPKAACHLVVAMAILFLSGCETPQQKKRVKLPGEGEVSTLGWNRGFPGDPQPGLGAMPQSR